MKSGSTGVFINLKNYIIGIEGQITKRVLLDLNEFELIQFSIFCEVNFFQELDFY